jgi:hypothetical protein
MHDWMLENGVSGKNGFGSDAFSLDLDQITIATLKGRGTQYLVDAVQDGADRTCDEFRTECGFKIRNEKYHARMYNITDWAA